MDMDWSTVFTNFVNGCVSVAGRLLLSLIVFALGVLFIKLLLKLFPNGKKFGKMDETVRLFLNNFIKIALYVILAVIIISIMGVPMASVITVFATAGAAIALAVQGSLANFMGGIMLLIFRPISVGEVIKVADETGTVTEIGENYIKVDDSILMKNAAEGIEFTVYAEHMNIRRYIISGYLKVGDTVSVEHGYLPKESYTEIRNATNLEECVITSGGEVLIPE